MKKAILSLLSEIDSKPIINRVSRLEFKDKAFFFKEINNLLFDGFFSYHLTKSIINSEDDLNNSFVLSYAIDGKIKYIFLKKNNNQFYSSELGLSFSYEEIYGSECIFLKKKPIEKTSKDFVLDIFSMFPKVNFYLLATLPLLLIPAFYANLFNTRMIFNSSSMTLVYVTSVLIVLLFTESILKSYVKKKHLHQAEKNSTLIEKYLLNLSSFFSGDNLISKVRMIESNKKQVWDNLSGILIDFFSFALFFIVLFFLIGSNVFFLFFFYFILIVLSIFFRYRYYKAYIEKENKASDLLLSRISYYKDSYKLPLRNYGSIEDNFTNHLSDSQKLDYELGNYSFKWEEFIRISNFLSSFFLFMVVFFSKVDNEAIFTVLIAILLINGRVTASIIGVANKSFQLVIAVYHIESSIKQLLDKTREHCFLKGHDLDVVEKISLDDFTLENENEMTLLENVNFEFKKGIIYGLGGANGSGKSSLAKAICSINDNFKGRISFNGDYQIKEIDSSFFEKKIGFLDVDSDLLKGSFYFNCNSFGLNDKEIIQSIAKLAFPHETIDYEFMFEKDISLKKLSTGEKRKLLMLITLHSNKEIIVIDEIFSNLSDQDTFSLFETMKNRFKDKIVLIISHDNNLLKRCDDLLFIKDKNIYKQNNNVVRM